MIRANINKILSVRCHTHPRYAAEHKPRTKCKSCWLLYVLRWQYGKDPDKKLGSLNPYQYLIGDIVGDTGFEDACSGIELGVL